MIRGIGDTGTGGIYVRIMEGHRTAVQSKVLIEQMLVHNFGSMDQAKAVIRAYTAAIANAQQRARRQAGASTEVGQQLNLFETEAINDIFGQPVFYKMIVEEAELMQRELRAAIKEGRLRGVLPTVIDDANVDYIAYVQAIEVIERETNELIKRMGFGESAHKVFPDSHSDQAQLIDEMMASNPTDQETWDFITALARAQAEETHSEEAGYMRHFEQMLGNIGEEAQLLGDEAANVSDDLFIRGLFPATPESQWFSQHPQFNHLMKRVINRAKTELAQVKKGEVGEQQLLDEPVDTVGRQLEEALEEMGLTAPTAEEQIIYPKPAFGAERVQTVSDPYFSNTPATRREMLELEIDNVERRLNQLGMDVPERVAPEGRFVDPQKTIGIYSQNAYKPFGKW